MSWIVAGTAKTDTFPVDALTPPELEELRKLNGAREELVQRVAMVEQQMSLFITVCRDRRGLTGRVRVNAETGAIAAAGEAQGGTHAD